MPTMFDTLEHFFKEDEWVVSRLEGRDAVSMNFQGKNGRWSCYARTEEAKEIALFYSYCPVKAPQELRAAIAEYISRANYGLLIGNFELDYADGEIRFKTSVDVEGDELSVPLVKRLVYDNVGTLDRYLPGILEIIYGKADPRAAIDQIEGTATATATQPVADAEVLSVVPAGDAS
jgi:hypothetical protein